MALDLTNLVPVYQQNIDALIEQLGKYVELYFEDTVSNVQPDFYDPVRGGEVKQPSFKGSDTTPSPTVSNNKVTIKALHKYAPKEWNVVAPYVNEAASILRLKTFLTDVPNLIRAKYIVPSLGAQGIVNTRFRLLKEAIPVGLQVDRYAITYWIRI